jgi:hypothetical protein
MNIRNPFNQYARVGQVRKKESAPDSTMDNFIMGMTNHGSSLEPDLDQ